MYIFDIFNKKLAHERNHIIWLWFIAENWNFFLKLPRKNGLLTPPSHAVGSFNKRPIQGWWKKTILKHFSFIDLLYFLLSMLKVGRPQHFHAACACFWAGGQKARHHGLRAFSGISSVFPPRRSSSSLYSLFTFPSLLFLRSLTLRPQRTVFGVKSWGIFVIYGF